MKILQIGNYDLPIREGLTCGGTQRVILGLDNFYTTAGHKSYVIATQDSEIKGTLIPTGRKFLCQPGETIDPLEKLVRIEQFYEDAFRHILMIKPDIIHDQARFSCSEIYKNQGWMIDSPIVLTFHSHSVEESEIKHLRGNESVRIVGLSQDHKEFLERLGLNVRHVVYNGVALDDYPFESQKRDYLFSIGRIIPSKGQDIAIRVAKETGKGLVIAGEVYSFFDKNVMTWWRNEVLPHIDQSLKLYGTSEIDKLTRTLGNRIVFVNGVNDNQKIEFYKKAACLISPTQTEAFGLTILESLATGTPVITFNNSSLPEVIAQAENGFLTNDEEEMIDAVRRLNLISPRRCRETLIENGFTLEKQAITFLNIYRGAIRKHNHK